MKHEGKHIMEMLTRAAPTTYDPYTDDMTVQFAIQLAEKDVEIGRLNAALENEAIIIRELRERVAEIGEIANVCTYDSLGAVCGYCRCHRRSFVTPPAI